MRLILRYILIQIFMLPSLIVMAHKPDLSSTLLVEQEDNVWVIQIRSALTGFEYEIENHYGKDSYATPEEFQNLVLQHVKQNLSISSNGNTHITFQNGNVKLGHETSVTFEVNGMPSKISTLDVKNSSFSSISRNQSALIIIKKGFAKDQFKLDKNNNHSVQLKVKNSKFELISQEVTNTNKFYLYGGIVIFIVLIIYLFRSKQQAKMKELTLQNT